MPGWHARTEGLRASGKLQLIGVVEEQHPDRARLFMQWQRMNWPVLVDSFNELEVPAVPIVLGVDEHGVVRLVNPRSLADVEAFVRARYGPPGRRASTAPAPGAPAVALAPDPAVERFEREAEARPRDPRAWFRLGVALLARHDSAGGRAGDFQLAIAAWTRSLELDPNDYITRRRLQQYGPRLAKPYPFYDWVDRARREIATRGEEPAPLRVEPTATERAGREPPVPVAAPAGRPDPEGRVTRDDGLVELDAAVVPEPVRPGQPLALHLVFRPNRRRDAHWNNEGGAMVTWIEAPAGWRIDANGRELPAPLTTVSDEVRRLEYELVPPAGAPAGTSVVRGYTLVYVCEGRTGKCLYRRMDHAIPVRIEPPR